VVGAFLDFELRDRRPGMARIDLGDQLIALSEAGSQPADDSRHFGLVVDDKVGCRVALRAAGLRVPSSSLACATREATTSKSSTTVTSSSPGARGAARHGP